MSEAVARLVPEVGVKAACAAVGAPRSSYYRAKRGRPTIRTPRPRPPRALSDAQRSHVLLTLDSEQFADKAPRQVYAELLDDGVYICSVSTMYRILRSADQVRDRRNQRRHPAYVKPELVASAPNQVWTWDITKVPGPTKGVYYSLYVALDLFSRYVVGWTLARTESAALAHSFLVEAYRRHAIWPGQLVCHSDRGAPMTAKSTALLYSDLGIRASHSRPRVSNDNPYSEAAFRTFLYRPEMPERFGGLEDARQFFHALFDWYNNRHYHSGIALLTPDDVHSNRAAAIIASRQRVLDLAYQAHAERFVRHPPRHPPLPAAAWINPPAHALVQI